MRKKKVALLEVTRVPLSVDFAVVMLKTPLGRKMVLAMLQAERERGLTTLSGSPPGIDEPARRR